MEVTFSSEFTYNVYTKAELVQFCEMKPQVKTIRVQVQHLIIRQAKQTQLQQEVPFLSFPQGTFHGSST